MFGIAVGIGIGLKVDDVVGLAVGSDVIFSHRSAEEKSCPP